MDIKKIVVATIKEVAGIEKISDEESLRVIGIDSIGFIEIIVEIENKLNIEIPDDFLLFSGEDTVESFYKNINRVYSETH